MTAMANTEGPALWISATVTILASSMLAFVWAARSLHEWIYVGPYLRKGKTVPPGYLGWPFIGEMLDFLKCFKGGNPVAFLHQRYQKYGVTGLYRSHLFGSAAVLATSPDAIKFVLNRDDLFRVGWPSKHVMGKTALISLQVGDHHKRLRKYLHAAVGSPEAMKAALPTIYNAQLSSIETWEKRGTINLRKETKFMQIKIICLNFMSISKPTAEVMNELDHHYENFMKGIRAYPLNIPGTAHYNARRSRAQMMTMVQNLIDDRRRTRDNREDFLHMLMTTQDENGNRLTDEEIKDNLVSLTLAGFESTAYSVMWVLYYLAKDPEALAKLREEQFELKKRIGDRMPSWEETKRMRYTNKIFNETVRITNVAPLLYRTAAQDINFKGFMIPKGWKVQPWIMAPHLDESIYPAPMTWNPDRWDDVEPRAGTFVPFGGGSRTCVGNQFAQMQVCIFLHLVATKYKWTLLTPNGKVTNLPHPKPIDGAPCFFEKL